MPLAVEVLIWAVVVGQVLFVLTMGCLLGILRGLGKDLDLW